MRRALIRIHLWLGLTIGLLWALQGLTGALLVFHREIDRMTGPVAVGNGPRLPLDTLIDRAEAAAGAPVERIGLVDARPDLLAADVKDADGVRRAVLLDAATGAVVGLREREPISPMTGSATRWIFILHEKLLLGDRGETLIGVSGGVLLSSLLLGLWVGWPRRRGWRAAFSLSEWRSLPQKLYGWHRAAGLTLGFVLILIVPAGIYMIFSEPIRAAVALIAPHQFPYKPAPVPVVPPISAETALAAAQARFPEAALVRVTLPSAKAQVYGIRMHQPGETRAWSGMTTVTVDSTNGRVLHVYDAVRAPLSNRIVDAQLSLHNGEIGGLAGRLLVMLAGLSLPFFYVTGLWSWMARRRRAA